MSLHVYTAAMQPATAFVDRCGEVEIEGGFDAGTMIYTHCCGKKRLAEKCVVQCFYDGLSIWCAAGHGCKHPGALATKRRREHMNRSRGQQARRLREHEARALA